MPTEAERYPLTRFSDADLKKMYDFVVELCETTSELFDLQGPMEAGAVLARNLEYLVMQRLYVACGMLDTQTAENDTPPELDLIYRAFEQGLDLMDELRDSLTDSINEAILEGRLFRTGFTHAWGDFREIWEGQIESDYAGDIFESITEELGSGLQPPPEELTSLLTEICEIVTDSCGELGICDICIYSSGEVGRALRLAGEKPDAKKSTCDSLILDLYGNWMLNANTYYYAGWSYINVAHDVFWLMCTNAYDHSGYGDYYDNDETFRNYGFPMMLAVMSECARRINETS